MGHSLQMPGFLMTITKSINIKPKQLFYYWACFVFHSIWGVNLSFHLWFSKGKQFGSDSFLLGTNKLCYDKILYLVLVISDYNMSARSAGLICLRDFTFSGCDHSNHWKTWLYSFGQTTIVPLLSTVSLSGVLVSCGQLWSQKYYYSIILWWGILGGGAREKFI